MFSDPFERRTRDKNTPSKLTHRKLQEAVRNKRKSFEGLLNENSRQEALNLLYQIGACVQNCRPIIVSISLEEGAWDSVKGAFTAGNSYEENVELEVNNIQEWLESYLGMGIVPIKLISALKAYIVAQSEGYIYSSEIFFNEKANRTKQEVGLIHQIDHELSKLILLLENTDLQKSLLQSLHKTELEFNRYLIKTNIELNRVNRFVQSVAISAIAITNLNIYFQKESVLLKSTSQVLFYFGVVTSIYGVTRGKKLISDRESLKYQLYQKVGYLDLDNIPDNSSTE